jgi:hypothetical protein
MLTDPDYNDYDDYDIDYVNEVVALGADHTMDLLGSRIHTEPDQNFKKPTNGYKRNKPSTTIDYNNIYKGIV